MYRMDEDGNSFEETLRAMARELGQSVERAMEHFDVNDIAGMVGVDPERAREWVDGAGAWLRDHAEELQGFGMNRRPAPRDPTPAQPARRTASSDEAAFSTAAPHPLDLPTDEQGAALAALDSGRWVVEPGTEMLTSRGQGPGPSDALGLVRELRVRDWIAEDGQVTRAGRRALDRWLDATKPSH